MSLTSNRRCTACLDFGAVQSAVLNEAATLFRRRYYANGSHAGFILYVTDPAQHEEDIEAMRDQFIKSKGVGNFKNLFYYRPMARPMASS